MEGSKLGSREITFTPGGLKGKGQVEVMVNPLKKHLKPMTLTDQGKLTEIKGVALSSLLKERKVSERMAGECQKQLTAKGYAPKIDILYDTREFPVYQKASVQAGACLAIWARTDTGCLIGSDMAGAQRRSAEFIGKRIAKQLIDDLRSKATVDRYLADQIIPFMALAEGWSAYLIPKMTDHIKARLWLIEKILGGKAIVKNNLVRIKGIGSRRE